MRRHTIPIALFVMCIGANSASAETLTGAEIKSAFSGNSIVGDGDAQYFAPDGVTIYQDGATKKSGKWSVSGDKYCSAMEGGKKNCFTVRLEKGRVSFKSKGSNFPYALVKGKKVK